MAYMFEFSRIKHRAINLATSLSIYTGNLKTFTAQIKSEYIFILFLLISGCFLGYRTFKGSFHKNPPTWKVSPTVLISVFVNYKLGLVEKVLVFNFKFF